MNVLIAGNLGYLGSEVTKLIKELYPSSDIYGLDTGFFLGSTFGHARLGETFLKQQIFGDIRSSFDLDLPNFDVCICLAAISNDPMGFKFEAATTDINVTGIQRLFNRVVKDGCSRFVFASSCSVYGNAGSKVKNESDPAEPLTAYAKSKIAIEKFLDSSASGTCQCTSLRFATACGVSDRLRLDLVLNDFVASAISMGKIQVLSDGSPYRPLIDVSDMARAIVWGISESRVLLAESHIVVNVGSSENTFTIEELANLVAREIPGTTISINRSSNPDNRSYCVDFSKFKELAPSSSPRKSLSQTIVELASLMDSNRSLLSDFRQSQFIRLNTLAKLQDMGFINESLRWNAGVSAK